MAGEVPYSKPKGGGVCDCARGLAVLREEARGLVLLPLAGREAGAAGEGIIESFALQLLPSHRNRERRILRAAIGPASCFVASTSGNGSAIIVSSLDYALTGTT